MSKRNGGSGSEPSEAGRSRSQPLGSTISLGAIFCAFLKLGLTSFGGPVAHIGYFRMEFVHRRRWLDDSQFGDIVTLCQFLPGPASSQVGFAIGMAKGGLLGGLIAWGAFTAPSAILMIAAASGIGRLSGPSVTGAIHGLKLVAVAIVAQAVWGMVRTLAPDKLRLLIALIAFVILALTGGVISQVAVLIGGAATGWLFCRTRPIPAEATLQLRTSQTMSWAALALFVGLLLGLPLVGTLTSARGILVMTAFFQSGALVFGGGHVVLPLLDDRIVKPGWVSPDASLAGYALAQALPGPLFTFAAYLGALLQPGPNGIAGGLLGLVAIFLPGLLLLVGIIPFWDALRSRARTRAAMHGANAVVVGILAAALYSPLWISTVRTPLDLVIAAAAFVALTVARIAPVWMVAAGIIIGAVLRASGI